MIKPTKDDIKNAKPVAQNLMNLFIIQKGLDESDFVDFISQAISQAREDALLEAWTLMSELYPDDERLDAIKKLV